MGGRWLQPKFGGSAAVAELPCICAAQPGPHLPTQGFKSAVHQHQSLRMIPQDTKPTQLRCRDRAQPLSGPGTVSPVWLCPAKGAVSSHCSRSRACSSQPCSAGSQHCIQLASLLMSFSSAPGHRHRWPQPCLLCLPSLLSSPRVLSLFFLGIQTQQSRSS